MHDWLLNHEAQFEFQSGFPMKYLGLKPVKTPRFYSDVTRLELLTWLYSIRLSTSSHLLRSLLTAPSSPRNRETFEDDQLEKIVEDGPTKNCSKLSREERLCKIPYHPELLGPSCGWLCQSAGGLWSDDVSYPVSRQKNRSFGNCWGNFFTDVLFWQFFKADHFLAIIKITTNLSVRRCKSKTILHS